MSLLMCDLFNGTLICLRLYGVELLDDWQINFRGSGRKRSLHNLRQCLRICVFQ